MTWVRETEHDPNIRPARLRYSSGPAPMSVVQSLRAPSDPVRLQALHGEMVQALMAGGGLHAIADRAAQAAGGRVVVDLPREGLAASTPGGGDAVTLCVPVTSGSDRIGAVALYGDTTAPIPAEAADALHAAAMAALTYVALLRGDDPRHDAGARLLDAVLDGAPHALAGLRTAGFEPGHALAAALPVQRTGHVLAALADHAPGAIRTVRDGWLLALVPAEADGTRVAVVLHEQHDVPAAGAPAATDPALALREARLAAQVVADGAAGPGALAGGTWRLLVRAALRNADEVRALATEALGALATDDSRAAAEQLRTFSAYIANSCNMNATAAAMPAHRHTVSYRLERVREVTGLDPLDGEGREQLGVAVKARAVAAACDRLPRAAPRLSDA
jgi:hypothetical protein